VFERVTQLNVTVKESADVFPQIIPESRRGALANAIYNACGVRIREHPITREKIMAGLKASTI